MDNKIVQQYIDNPIRALHEDQTLKIVEIIVKMNKSIELNKLNLKEIKKRKIVQECSLLTKEFFVNFLTEKIKLVNELTEVETSISSENIIQEITLLERKAKENENAIEITEKSILDLKNQKSPVSSNDIEQMIEEKLDKKVKLILPIQYNN